MLRLKAGAPLDRSKVRRGSGDGVIAGAGGRLVVDRLLEIIVETFIRGVFRRIGLKSENLDLVLVVRQPFLNRCRAFVEEGLMDVRIADDQKDFSLRVPD